MSSLNIELILSDGNLHRDWRGLSSLFKCTKFDKAAVQHHENKTRKLIEISTSINRDLKFNDLLENLQRIGRFDVYDDVIETMGLSQKIRNLMMHKIPILACDAHRYVSQPSAPSEDTDEDPFPRSQFGSFSSLSVPSCPVETSSYQVPVIPPLPEDHFITKDDKKFRKAQHYHAFVLYDENDVVHIQNVLDIVGKLEKMRFNLCIKERDFLMGIGMEHSAVMDMIEQRCYRVIIFVTRGIFSSSYNNFIMQFCQRQAIGESVVAS